MRVGILGRVIGQLLQKPFQNWTRSGADLETNLALDFARGQHGEHGICLAAQEAF